MNAELVDLRRRETAALLSSDAARAALAVHGTPLLLLSPERVRRQYRRLRAALPFVRFHYAVKALADDAVIAALAGDECCFDVATGEELAIVRRHGIHADRVIHTHPIKKPSEIVEAMDAGVRTFVVDNETELAKFEGAPPDVRLLVRLAYRSPHAKSDLSTKFGVGPVEAGRLLGIARARGIRIAGFSFHVGSQLDDPDRFATAVTETLALMDALEREHGLRFTVLDIGGGFPVAYDEPVSSIETLGARLRAVLEPYAHRLDIIAEPGRILVAESMTLITSVVGVAERGDGRWYYLDDGVYGSYSNVIAEDVQPLVFAVRELFGAEPDAHRWSTVAGPTCDSTDVVAREAMLPDLVVGDLVASPVMGAYTAVTATRFNGRALTPIAVVGFGMPQPTAAVRRVPRASDCAVEPIAGVAEAGHDVALLVEPLVERAQHEGHVAALDLRLDRGDALGRAEDADRRDVLRAAVEEELDRGAERTARREHRVEHEALAVAQVVGKALGVGRRLERLFVARHAEEPDLGGGEQFDHSLEHPETRTEDRNDERARLADLDARRGRDRRLDLDRLDTHVPRRLVREQRHELLGQLTEHGRRRALVAQDRELVGDERVFRDVQAHRARLAGVVVSWCADRPR
ncbi:hypothetical protein GCM10009775_06050 [Microbacterium aoyamense]|uniref:ornithine decarboxylase n=1 Tax=Microbacterium aoyamense TaxID=344166 RepID=A0ABN2PDV7_9MICO